MSTTTYFVHIHATNFFLPLQRTGIFAIYTKFRNRDMPLRIESNMHTQQYNHQNNPAFYS